MKRTVIGFLFVFLMSTIACASVWAQATAQIGGTVRDQSGAVLPGVEVTVTRTDTGIRRNAVTNETGTFVLPNLVVGPYRLEAALPGFRTFVQTGIILQVNSNAVINPVLEVGQVTESVEVQANVTQVETRSTAVGQVIENERILELPLNGRQVTDLITLSGAAVQTGSSGNQSMPGGANISIAGGLSFGVSYALDGAMHNDPYAGSNLVMPFPDALQEFRVEAAGLSANSGMKSGGAVNAVTKSGTNEFHGDLFEFVRNYKFNARDYFALNRDSLKRNQYGGTIGGPIKQNKLFFFGGYQGTKTRSDPGTTIRYVPTAAMIAGDFRAFASPACNAGRQIALRAPFVNNKINPTQFSPAAMKLVPKLPQATDDCGKVTYGLVSKINEWQSVGKVDYQWSDKHSLFGRYMATVYDQPPPYTYSSSNLLTSTDAGFDNLAQSYAVGSTYLFSPNTINALRLTVNRTAIKRYHPDIGFAAPDLGVKSYSFLKDYLIVTVTGGFNVGGGSAQLSTFRTTSYQIADDVNLIRGNHQLSLGVNLSHWRTNQYAHIRDSGTFNFDGSASGLGIADFMMGQLTNMRHGSAGAWGTRQDYIAIYAADNWKATPRLSLSYGLRWEPFLPLKQNLGIPYAFDEKRFLAGIKSKQYPQAPAGLYYPGDEGFPDSGSPMANHKALFNPRVGLAWDIEGNGRTSLRASGGIATDLTVTNLFGGGTAAPPWGFDTEVRGASFDDPWRDYPGGSPVPYALGAGVYTSFATLATFAEGMRPPTSQSWTLSLQRQVTSDWLASASYMGSSIIHTWAQKALNRSVYFPGNPVNGVCTAEGFTLRVASGACSTTGNTNDRRRFNLMKPGDGQYLGVLNQRDNGGTGNYHGLVLSLQRRASSGVNIGANYTWSHCIGLANTFNTNEDGEYLKLDDRDFDRGNCDSDRRHIFNLTSVATTPQFAQPTLRLLASNWRLSGIYRFSTGSWFTVLAGEDRALIGQARTGTQRPVQVLGNPYGDRGSLTNYVNANAFLRPDVGAIGNMRPMNIEGPSTFQFDLALSRAFALREGQNLEVRAEAFNVTNSLRRGNPTNNFRSGTFGQITTAREARIMQFAVKYIF
jgi:Carboxypeptidase regulatory-like domain